MFGSPCGFIHAIATGVVVLAVVGTVARMLRTRTQTQTDFVSEILGWQYSVLLRTSDRLAVIFPAFAFSVFHARF